MKALTLLTFKLGLNGAELLVMLVLDCPGTKAGAAVFCENLLAEPDGVNVLLVAFSVGLNTLVDAFNPVFLVSAGLASCFMSLN